MAESEHQPEKIQLDKATADVYRRSIGHYLLNSISPLIGYPELLQNPNLPRDKQLEYLKEIAKAADILTQQIQALISAPIDNLVPSVMGEILDIPTEEKEEPDQIT